MNKNSPKNKNSEIPAPSEVLLNKIMDRIGKEKKLRETKRRVVLFSFGLGISLTAVVPAYNWVGGQIVETGFGDFLSLAWFDYEIAINYWGVFVMALLESFPVAESITFLFVVFFALGSLRFLARDAKILFDQLNNKIKISN